MNRDLVIYILCAFFLLASVIDLNLSARKGTSKKRAYSLSTWGIWLGLVGIVLEGHSPTKNLAFILILLQALQVFMTMNLSFKPEQKESKTPESTP